jgi:nucleoside-diphosphate-sugar epimerase
VRAARPELVYHIAAHGSYPSQTDAGAILKSNVLGTQNLLAATAGVDYEAFVNAGSSSEYGFKDSAMRESDRLEPNSYYAVAKAAQTLLCQYVARAQKRPINTLRLFSVYGPYEEPSRLIPTLVRRCLEGTDLTLASPGTARDFIYVDDVVDAFLAVDRLSQLCGEILNIGSGTQTTLGEVVDLVVRLTRADVRRQWNALPARVWDTDTWVADRSRSKQLLGWQPATALAKGLARTITWMQERGSVSKVA